MLKKFFTFLILFSPIFSIAQLVDSAVVKVHYSKPYDDVWHITSVTADSFYLGQKVYSADANAWYLRDGSLNLIEERFGNYNFPSARRNYHYNSAVDTIHYEHFSGMWINDSLELKYHDINGDDSLILIYTWISNAWSEYEKHEVSNTGGNPTNEIVYRWDTNLLIWNNFQQIIFSGSVKIIQSWDGLQWNNEFQIDSTTGHYNIEIWGGGGWENYETHQYSYNANNQLILDDVGTYPSHHSISYLYDTNGILLSANGSSTTMSGNYDSYWRDEYYYFNIPTTNDLYVVTSDYQICSADSQEISITVLGGTPPYSYQWTPSYGLTDDTIPNPLTFIDSLYEYDVIVTDANGNSATATSTVNVQTSVDANFSIQSVDTSDLCNSAYLTIFPTNATYCYWFLNGNQLQGTGNGITITQNGTYRVEAHRSNYCTRIESIQINFFNHPPAMATIHFDSCKTNLIADCPACSTFKWYKNNFQITGATNDSLPISTSGYYEVQTTDTNQCVVTSLRKNYDPFRPSFSTHTDNTCFGDCEGRLTIYGTNGNSPYTYLWSNGATTINIDNLCSGLYNITITDAHGCTITVNDTVKQPASPVSANIISSPSMLPDSCEGQLNIIPSGNLQQFTYNVLLDGTNSIYGLVVNDTGVANHLCEGWHTIRVTNGGCQFDDSVYVHVSSGCTVNAVGFNITCNGICNGNLFSIANGLAPFEYFWSNGDTLDNSLHNCSGTYTILIRDSTGCTADTTITLSEPSPLNLYFSPQSVSCIGCNDGSVGIIYGGGIPPYTFTLNSMPVVLVHDEIDNLVEGTYNICLIDSNGCSVCNAVTILNAGNSISEIEIKSFEVFPNPAHDLTNIICGECKDGDAVNVVDLTGRAIVETNIRNKVATIEMRNTKYGFYLITVNVSGKIVTKYFFRE